MEQKKSPKADLQNKRGLLLEIGLIISLGLVIAAFSYAPKEYRIEQVEQVVEVVETEMTEITRQPEQQQEQAPRKVEVKVISDILDIVTNDTQITTELSFDEFDEEAAIEPIVEIKEEEIVEDQPFLIAEEMPSFQGGDINVFRKWVQDNVRFPQIALENGIQGTVVIAFVVERDGTLTILEVLASPDRSLTDEAVRVLKQSPKWTPGKQRNQAVRVRYNLPVVFRLQN